MENSFKKLLDIALNEFNYILDVNLTEKIIEQVATNIPQIPKNITYDFYMTEFGNNVPFSDFKKARGFINHISRAVEKKDYTTQIVELRFENYENRTKFDWSSVKCIYEEKSNGDLHGYIISRDITAEKENEIEVIRSSQRDPLTGLINRFGYSLLANQSLLDSVQNNKKMAFFFLDIDNYKFVNDIYGHQIGDKVLIRVADKLLKIFDNKDIVCRYGGDEFIVVLQDMSDIESVKEFGQLICDEVTSISLPDSKFKLSCSVGVSLFPDHSLDLDELIHLADLALYQAKNSGKNRYCLYDKSNLETDSLYNHLKVTEDDSFIFKLYEYIVNQSNIGILATDAENYDIIYANKRFLDIFELSKPLKFEDTKCYEYIYDYSGPCPTCSLKKKEEVKKIVRIKSKEYYRKIRMVNFFGKIIYIFYYEELHNF